MRFLIVWAAFLWGCGLQQCAVADVFGLPDYTFEIEFVDIGAAGNPADVTGMPRRPGAVDYVYRMGKHEVSREMIEKANALGSLGITVLDMSTLRGNGPNQPATGISWFEAAMFVNWLNSSSGYPEAYNFTDAQFEVWQPGDEGYDAENPFRHLEARYFLPSANEWYKAAYFDPETGDYYDYPTGSNSAPTPVSLGTQAGTAVFDNQVGPAEVTQAGGLSPFGTMAQGGNVEEWEETDYHLKNNEESRFRGIRGGQWVGGAQALSASSRSGVRPDFEDHFISYGYGFRVASRADEVLLGDFNGNSILDATDIDELVVSQTDPRFDLTEDGVVNDDDRDFWVHELAGTYFGDANLDHEFNSLDFVEVFQRGHYEDAIQANSGWSAGDWNGDHEFDSADFVKAFQDGGYEQGPRMATVSTPEPTGRMLLILGLMGSIRVLGRGGATPETTHARKDVSVAQRRVFRWVVGETPVFMPTEIAFRVPAGAARRAS